MKVNKRTILLVTSEFPPQPGGIGNHAFQLARALSDSGFDIQVITDQRSDSGEDEKTFDSKQLFKVLRIKKYSIRVIMYIKRLLLMFSTFKKADTVLASGKFSLWSVAVVNLFYRKKSVAVVHGSEVNYKSFILKKSIDVSLKQFDGIISVSHFTKNLIKHLDKSVCVIPNGIDIASWKHTEHFSKERLRGNPKLITVGRLSLRKGQAQVIKHLPELVKFFPELHYHCIGISKELKYFKELATSLGVESYVTFHGSLPDDELKEKLSQSDIFVMLSTESEDGDVEGFGIALLEANALGIPTIGAMGCGIEDAINNESSGILISLEDTLSFKNAIDTILKNKEYYKQGAYSWAKQHDWKYIVKRYIKIIE